MCTSERIKKLRIEKKLTQPELAEKLGSTRQKVADWERGKSLPSINDLKKLCEIFETTTDYLLCLSTTPTKDRGIQYICDYTGLSEQSIKWLHALRSTANILKKALGTEDEYNGNIIEIELSIIDSMIMLANGNQFIKKMTELTIDCLSTVGNITMDKNNAIIELVTNGPTKKYSSWLDSSDEHLEKYHMILFRAQNAVMGFLDDYCKEEIEEWNQIEGCLNKIDLYLKQSIDNADYDLEEIRKIGEDYGFYPKEE